MLWTVVRFPDGSWSSGGSVQDPDYENCEIWRIDAYSRDAAVRKAQGRRARARAKMRKVNNKKEQ